MQDSCIFLPALHIFRGGFGDSRWTAASESSDADEEFVTRGCAGQRRAGRAARALHGHVFPRTIHGPPRPPRRRGRPPPKDPEDPDMRTMNIARVVSLSLALCGCAAQAADDGIKVPAGFTATVVQEGLGAGRHLA